MNVKSITTLVTAILLAGCNEPEVVLNDINSIVETEAPKGGGKGGGRRQSRQPGRPPNTSGSLVAKESEGILTAIN